MLKLKILFIVFISLFISFFSLNLISANVYYTDIYFTTGDAVYTTNERVEIKGYVYQSNYTNNGTLVNSSSAVANASVNLTLKYGNNSVLTNYTFITDSTGAFYSKSNYNTSATEITAPSTAGTYKIRAQYTDLNSNISFSEIEISVVNQTLDLLKVHSDKAIYNPSETMSVAVEAIRLIGDRLIFVSNVSVNGTLRNSSKSSLQTFSCTTGSNGKCSVSLTSPSTYGSYLLELNNYKTFTTFSVIPFSYVVYVKDIYSSKKNVFAVGEQAQIEVQVNNASSSDTYTFSGYISDGSGNSVKSISSTTLNSTNSFTNTFSFTLDSTTFSYGSYSAYVTIVKSGDGNLSSISSFRVKEWELDINKKETNSGFQYEYSTFVNSSLRFEALPTYRANGSVIENITASSFIINLKDTLGNLISSTNATWNASCGKSGCYEISLTAPSNTGRYSLEASLSHNGDIQTQSRIINVVSGVLSAQSINKDGDIKDLFDANEYVYISLSVRNSSGTTFNLTDAEIFLVVFENGTEFNYTNVSNFSMVNNSNSNYEWAWNSTSQSLKLDVPKAGGAYSLFVFGDNRTLGTEARFIVNPYNVCSVPKNTVGSVSGSGYYYLWQFKTTDTIYFEIKATQATNPIGKAAASNFSSTNGTGTGSACYVDTQTTQVVSNATINISEVKNAESGAVQSLNLTESVCKSDNNEGRYTCTVKALTKWDGGNNVVKFKIEGSDGTTSVFYGRFESRAFYLYGWSQNWQVSPESNVTLNVQMYEAGNNWWSSGGGLSGSVSVKKIEYQGRDGEWLWPPVDSGYNVSRLNSTSITTGSNSITLPINYTSNGTWKTGYYRVVLQGTTSAGDTDYGYAWFGVKLWDVYGQPIECLNTSNVCNYKSYFNSRDNISLYVKISKAGSYNYNDQGGQDIYGNVTISVKKIQNCRTWPCKDLNSSQYNATSLNVNSSSPWYWNALPTNVSRYILQINSTSGTWGTGYYNVILNVNNTDTGYAWFNTIAFYVETHPVNVNGSNYKYTIKGSEKAYFNVTTTKNYKYWNGDARYNTSDYINTSLVDVVLRTWDQTTYRSVEYNYPEDLSMNSTAGTNATNNGIGRINISRLSGNWATGYYWGELTLRDTENQTSSGWLWFNVQPFRVLTQSSIYNVDSDQCVNVTLNIYDADWYSNSLLYGNYSVTSVYEEVWGGSGNSRTSYTNITINGTSVNGTDYITPQNYTTAQFNASANNMTLCPNGGSWGSGSWGGYHYLNILVRDNVQNDTQSGWLSFRTVPFQISWGSTGSGKTSNENFNVTVNLTKSSGASANGNLTKLYQWRYDNFRSEEEQYVFKVGSCLSNVSSQCNVSGVQNITIYAPSDGWKIGYNYIQSVWTKDTDSSSVVQDYSGIYFDVREVYNGYFYNQDSNGNWKYDFASTENIQIGLSIRDFSYNAANVNVTAVYYSYSGENCWGEWCRSYTSATYSPSSINGNGIINITAPAGGWTRGYYSIKASVSGVNGTATITGGNVRIKDMTPPNMTITSPVNNATYNISNGTLSFRATTTENSQCYLNVVSYGNFYNWYCYNWNSTNSTTNATINSTQQEGACNSTRYNYTGNSIYSDYVSNNYHSADFGSNGNYSYCYSQGGGGNYCSGNSTSRVNTYMITGGTTHTYSFNVTEWTAQSYGLSLNCYDDDYNRGIGYTVAAFKIS